MTHTKTCTHCHETKPLDEFHRDNNPRNTSDGRRSWCKTCVNAAKRERRRKRGLRSPGRKGDADNRTDASAWECIHDPTGCYTRGRFPTIDFAGTLKAGYWPERSRWRGSADSQRPTTWRVEGAKLIEESGRRVAVPAGRDNCPTLRVMEVRE